jgi:hypothetical protein
MKSKIGLLAAITAFSAPASENVISLVCTAPGGGETHRVVLDIGKRAVLQDGRPGNIAVASGDAIHYFVRTGGRIQANFFRPADDSLLMAIARAAPEQGYERRQLSCRRE